MLSVPNAGSSRVEGIGCHELQYQSRYKFQAVLPLSDELSQNFFIFSFGHFIFTLSRAMGLLCHGQFSTLLVTEPKGEVRCVVRMPSVELSTILSHFALLSSNSALSSRRTLLKQDRITWDKSSNLCRKIKISSQVQNSVIQPLIHQQNFSLCLNH